MNPNFRETIDFRSDLYTAAMTVFEYAAQRHPLAQNQDDMVGIAQQRFSRPSDEDDDQSCAGAFTQGRELHINSRCFIID